MDKKIIPIEQQKRTHVLTNEAAFYLNENPKTLLKWIKDKNGPIRPVNIYGRKSWPIVSIKRYIEQKKIEKNNFGSE